jgi:alkylhydroperoxidase family enzyme
MEVQNHADPARRSDDALPHGNTSSAHRKSQRAHHEAGLSRHASTIRQSPWTLKVHSARLPVAFGLFYGKVARLDKKLLLPQETVLLIRGQVARINVCLFCMDIGRSFAIKAAMSEEKFDALEHYGTNPSFTDAERAALDYATELTRNKHVNRATFDRLSRYYSEREICEIVWLVASEHLYNITNLGLNIHSDLLCNIGGRS